MDALAAWQSGSVQQHNDGNEHYGGGQLHHDCGCDALNWCSGSFKDVSTESVSLPVHGNAEQSSRALQRRHRSALGMAAQYSLTSPHNNDAAAVNCRAPGGAQSVALLHCATQHSRHADVVRLSDV